MNIYYLGTHQFSVLSDILLNGLRFSRVTSARQWNCDLLTFLPLIEHTAPHGWLSSERNSKTSWVTPIQWVTENTPVEVGRKAETHAINPSLLQLLENLPAPVSPWVKGLDHRSTALTFISEKQWGSPFMSSQELHLAKRWFLSGCGRLLGGPTYKEPKTSTDNWKFGAIHCFPLPNENCGMCIVPTHAEVDSAP